MYLLFVLAVFVVAVILTAWWQARQDWKRKRNYHETRR